MKYEIITSDSGTKLIIRSDKLDNKLAPELKSLFINLISDEQSGSLLIDLKAVSFADSSGLSALLLAHRLYRDANRQLIFYNLSDRVSKLISISQLTGVFNIAADENEAQSLLK